MAGVFRCGGGASARAYRAALLIHMVSLGVTDHGEELVLLCLLVRLIHKI